MLRLEGGCLLPDLIRSQSDSTNNIGCSACMCTYLHLCVRIGVSVYVYVHMPAYVTTSHGFSHSQYLYLKKPDHWTVESFEFEVVRPPAGEMTGTSRMTP